MPKSFLENNFSKNAYFFAKKIEFASDSTLLSFTATPFFQYVAW